MNAKHQVRPVRVPLTLKLCPCTDDSAPGTVTADPACADCRGGGILAAGWGTEGMHLRARREFCQCAEARAIDTTGTAVFGCDACDHTGLALLTMEAVEARGERLRALRSLRVMARELAEAEGAEERRTLAAAGLSVLEEARWYGSDDPTLAAAESILGAVASVASDDAAREAARTLAVILQAPMVG